MQWNQNIYNSVCVSVCVVRVCACTSLNESICAPKALKSGTCVSILKRKLKKKIFVLYVYPSLSNACLPDISVLNCCQLRVFSSLSD